MATNAHFPAAGAAFLLTAALGLPTLAQDGDSQPQATTATYRDWTLRCDHLPENPPREVCEVVQAVRAQDGKAFLAQILIGRPAPGQPVRLIVQLPAGVFLPANAVLTAPSGETVTAIYTGCLQVCVADVAVDPAFVKALKIAKEPARLVFRDGNRRPIELPISLDGFSAAFSRADEPR